MAIFQKYKKVFVILIILVVAVLLYLFLIKRFLEEPLFGLPADLMVDKDNQLVYLLDSTNGDLDIFDYSTSVLKKRIKGLKQEKYSISLKQSADKVFISYTDYILILDKSKILNELETKSNKINLEKVLLKRVAMPSFLGLGLIDFEIVKNKLYFRSVQSFEQNIPEKPSFDNFNTAGGILALNIQSQNQQDLNFIDFWSDAPLIFNESNNHIYALNTAKNQVGVIDTETDKLIKIIKVGTMPLAGVFDPSKNILFVLNNEEGSISVIDTNSYELIKTIDVGSRPLWVSLAKDENKLYVMHATEGYLSVIDTESLKLITKIDLGWKPVAKFYAFINYDEFSNLIYVYDYFYRTLVVVNPKSDQIIKRIEGLDANINIQKYGFITDADQNNIFILDKSGKKLFIIKKSDWSVNVWADKNEYKSRNLYLPTDIAVNEEENLIYVLNQGNNTINVLDGGTLEFTNKKISTGNNPNSLIYLPEKKKIYTSDLVSNTVTLINLKTNETKSLIISKRLSGFVKNTGYPNIYVVNPVDNALTVINTDTDQVIGEINLGEETIHEDSYMSQSLNKIFFSDIKNNQLIIIDASTGDILDKISFKGTPYFVTANYWVPKENPEVKDDIIFVGVSGINELVVINGRNHEIIKRISLSGVPFRQIYFWGQKKIGVILYNPAYIDMIDPNTYELNKTDLIDDRRGLHYWTARDVNLKTGFIYIANTYTDSISVFGPNFIDFYATIKNKEKIIKDSTGDIKVYEIR